MAILPFHGYKMQSECHKLLIIVNKGVNGMLAYIRGLVAPLFRAQMVEIVGAKSAFLDNFYQAMP